jgi:peptide/nickel transport system substrate-binding protein
VYLSNKHGPTRDVRVRRAINLAVDRRVFVKFDGGPRMAQPTCQMLPVAFPAYRPYCPYSTAGDTDPYGGPDLTKARALIRAAHAEGADIAVGRMDLGDGRRVREVTRVLTAIGLRPRVRTIEEDKADRAGIDVMVGTGWIADYPDPSNFFLWQFSCARPESLYCNLTIAEQARAARQLANTDPGAALDAWTAIDRALTADAAFVALDNPSRAYLVSPRVGNYQGDQVGPILSQLWVK